MRSLSTISIFSTAALTLMLGLALFDSTRATPPETEPTAGQARKNIKVLTDLPNSQLVPVMQFMSASLGVDCGFCHAMGAEGHIAWESDENPHKDIARKMIRMTMEINRASFNGRTAISCNTCHRGAERPVGLPSLEVETMKPEEAEATGADTVLPAVADVIASYERAIGGAKALEKLNTRVISGNIVSGDGKKIPVEIRQRRPDRYNSVIVGPNGSITRGFDGTAGWTVTPRGTRRLEGKALESMRRASGFMSDLTVSPELTGLRLRGRDSVNGHAVYVVEGRIDSTTRERLFFDTKSGLLLRRLTLNATPIGEIPEQVDYDDYRRTDGIVYPFMMRVASVDASATATYRFDGVRHNVKIDDATFLPPAGK
jgi:hypothetical protein